MISFLLANSEFAPLIGDLLKVMTGAGGSVVAMYLWNKREVERADAAQERSDAIADRAIEALTQVNIFMVANEKAIDGVGGHVSAEHNATRDLVNSAINSLKGSDG